MTLIRRDFKSISTYVLKMIGLWFLAYCAFVFLRNFGIDERENFKTNMPLDLLNQFYLVSFLSILTGLFYAGLEILVDRPGFQKMPFGKIILIKTVLYVIMMRGVFLLVSILFAWLEGLVIDMDQIIKAMSSKIFWVLLFYFLFISALISFVVQVSQKFGPGMLWNFIIGKYHQPQVEERIFLFIDLHASTTHAENLGHLKYSRLIQDCFFDLTDVVTKHRVDVYQYVGDEAVLSWKKEKGLFNKRCIRAYFDYMSILENRKEYYIENYGMQPYFKAGLHMGKVSVAEVGVVKKEIAYHGDVLNTAARIQGECNSNNQSMLVSEEVFNNIAIDAQFKYELMGAPLLKGKVKKVNIYGVRTGKEEVFIL